MIAHALTAHPGGCCCCCRCRRRVWRQPRLCCERARLCLLAAPENAWITAPLGVLKSAQRRLAEQGIRSSIDIRAAAAAAIEIDDRMHCWDDLKAEMHRLIHILRHRVDAPVREIA